MWPRQVLPSSCFATSLQSWEDPVLVEQCWNYAGWVAVETPEDEWDAVLDVNLKAPFLLTQAFARSHMEGRDGGKPLL